MTREADPEVIQAACRRLAQKYHPDVAGDDEAAARMVAINVAWEILSDPPRRAAHDRERAERPHRATGAHPTSAPKTSATAAAGPPPGHTVGEPALLRQVRWLVAERDRSGRHRHPV